MEKKYALYTRQSVEKVDSISIESQLEHCKYETFGKSYKEYSDKGYSGKNTNRPAFEEMLNDIEQGKISKVIVYKLDRISRSILDFAGMMEFFQEKGVEFVSSTEKFDTSTPIGRAMLNICIVFAQLERETIQKRVFDAYHSRNKKGFYMGGRIPYGFNKKDVVIEGIKTAMYEQVPDEVQHIKLLFELYADNSNSLGDIVRYLVKHDIKHLRGSAWNSARISDMLRNPIYVKADMDVYNFYKSQGANIINPIESFSGNNACYLYQGTVSESRIQNDLKDKEIIIAPHDGIISSKVWLKCRVRCLNNRQSTQTGKAKNSWLSGKVKCGNCGYALVIKKANTKWKRYFICSCSFAMKTCKGTGCIIYADVLEENIFNQIKEKLSQFQTLSKEQKNTISPKINQNKIFISQIDDEIEGLLSKVSSANEILLKYINDKISELDTKRKTLQEENILLNSYSGDKKVDEITNHVEKWEEISFEDRKSVADILIKIIHISNSQISIKWNM